MSRLKELEQEKRRAERLASIEAIASGLAHEIRNPLVGIKTTPSYCRLAGTARVREMFRARPRDRADRRSAEPLP
jgi:C4-dicarboxylate-specific signal transduction histidine kinase